MKNIEPQTQESKMEKVVSNEVSSKWEDFKVTEVEKVMDDDLNIELQSSSPLIQSESSPPPKTQVSVVIDQDKTERETLFTSYKNEQKEDRK
eukprot:TRINITY_DN8090_c0_g1_i1.p1 TRINITY_DN8090_c0_g1~~TRINITY_DN8090_c0_g1_i1.p1  ORF type:complete len:100 (+),score=13.28 TRINITY_DN8090_c0_g1_i1:27-302(+)